MNAEPVIGLLPSGQFGRQCAKCQNPLGMALTPPSNFLGREDADTVKHRPAVPFVDKAAAAAMATPAPAPAPAPARAAPAPRAVQHAPAPAVDTTGMSAEEILRTRLAAAEAEVAHLEIEQARLHGLRVEVKSLRKMLSVTQATSRVSRNPPAPPPEPTTVDDLFAKN